MLFKELRKHQKLGARRNPIFEKNRFAKVLFYFMAMFWGGYLILLGVLFYFFFQKLFPSMEPYHILNKGLLYLFIVDFLLRFTLQKVPAQEIKPYLLLPIKKKKLFNFILLKSIFNGLNLIWFFLIIPFGLLTIPKFYGLLGLIFYCFGFWLLAILNNYWYLICKTLLNNKIIYILLPILLYGTLLIVEFTLGHPVSTFTMNLGEHFIEGNILSFLGVIICIGFLWLINRKIIYNNLYSELSKTNDIKVKNISEYKFLERYGEVGEYFRLELKMVFRNKRSKSTFRSASLLVIILTVFLFLPIDDGGIFTSPEFICIYNFAVFGIMMLSQIMSYEGNYLDGLMSRKESILNLLKAKYYFYSLAVLVPFLLMTPAIIMGKITILMAFSYSFFTIGFVYCYLFQMAVYNNKTVNLNENLVGRSGANTLQGIISLGAIGLPFLIVSMLKGFFGEVATNWILLISGVILMLSSNFWLRNIYNRFMKRRYKNMEGFRDTR